MIKKAGVTREYLLCPSCKHYAGTARDLTGFFSDPDGKRTFIHCDNCQVESLVLIDIIPEMNVRLEFPTEEMIK